MVRQILRNVKRVEEEKNKKTKRQKFITERRGKLQDEIDAIVTMLKLSVDDNDNYKFKIGEHSFSIFQDESIMDDISFEKKGLQARLNFPSSLTDAETINKIMKFPNTTLSKRHTFGYMTDYSVFFTDIYDSSTNGHLREIILIIFEKFKTKSTFFEQLMKGSGVGFNLHNHHNFSIHDAYPDIDIDFQTSKIQILKK